jgi:exonuclease III
MNKGMRLDHFIVSASLLPRVRACEAAAPQADPSTTRGPRSTHPSYYFGSDHWPIWLQLRPADLAGGAGAGEASGA